MTQTQQYSKGVRQGSVDFSAASLVSPIDLVSAPGVTDGLSTMCMWVLPTSTSGDWALCTTSNGSNYNGLGTNFGSPSLDVFDGGTFGGNLAPGFPTLNVWSFVCYVKDEGTDTGYQIGTDGVLTSITQGSAAIPANQQIYLSNDVFGSGSFPGCIAGFILYNAPLNARQVQAQSKQLAPILDNSVVSYLPCQNIGNAAIDFACTGRLWTLTGPVTRSRFSPPVPETIKKSWIWYA